MMDIKERAEAIARDREIWGSAWNEYETVTLIDIIRGKTQRIWNLVNKIEEETKVGSRGLSFSTIEKIRDNLLDAYNYSSYLKGRLIELDKEK